jgi:hypothetical protein
MPAHLVSVWPARTPTTGRSATSPARTAAAIRRARSYIAIALSTPIRRAGMIAFPTAILDTVVLTTCLVVGHALGAVALGIAAGTVAEAGVVAGHAIAGVDRRHPLVPLVRLLRPRIVLGVAFALYLELCVSAATPPRLMDSFLAGVRSTEHSSHWVFEILGVTLGFVGGQVVAYRVFTWDSITTWLADVAARPRWCPAVFCRGGSAAICRSWRPPESCAAATAGASSGTRSSPSTAAPTSAPTSRLTDARR